MKRTLPSAKHPISKTPRMATSSRVSTIISRALRPDAEQISAMPTVYFLCRPIPTLQRLVPTPPCLREVFFWGGGVISLGALRGVIADMITRP